MTTKREALLQAIGAYGVQCSETKELAPPRDLIKAIDEVTPEKINLDDNSFTLSFDAAQWAKAFVQHVWANKNIPYDEGCMVGWFANALMRGYDEHAWKHQIQALDNDVLRDVQDERIRQDEKWGGPKHDDTHSFRDWFFYRSSREEAIIELCRHHNAPIEHRKLLVEIAALAVAQIEALDRTA